MRPGLDSARATNGSEGPGPNGVHGVQVVYGLIGLETHCKVALVVRREGGGIGRYVHLGAGDYNPSTARRYTDVTCFTCRAIRVAAAALTLGDSQATRAAVAACGRLLPVGS